MKKVPVRKLVFGILGVVLGLIIGFMAPPAELTVESMHYLGLLVWFICWMIGGVMPDFMTGITFLVLAVLLKLCDFTTAFSPFAGTTTWLLIGAFGVGAMLNKTGVLRRIAYVIMQLFPGTYTGQMLALYAAGIIVSPMMPSITAKAALMSPLSIPAAEAFGFEKNSKGATGLFMASYWSSGILGNFFFTGCVYVGTMMAYLDEQTIAMLNFWSWLKYFWPYLLVFAVGGFFILRILFQPKEYQPLPAGFVKAKLKELGPMSRDEKLSLIILVIMVAGWLTADLTGISVTIWSVIGLILIVFVNQRSWLDPYIVVLRCDGEESEREATNFLTGSVSKCSVKSKTVRPDGVELNVEVRMKGESTGFVNALAAIPGVQSAVLVSYNGEYMG